MTDNRYPTAYPACIMCGAKAGQPCTVISGDPEQGEHPGDRRRYPHAYRAKPGQEGPREPFVAVKDEPDHWADECTDPECWFHHPAAAREPRP